MDDAPPSVEEIRAYIDRFADSIYVRVRLGPGREYRDMTIAELRSVDAGEAARVQLRLIERGALPHRVLIV